ncbi:MAG TPA: glucan biosynthesis protein [Steroidobacteraceae bacterium]|nr:glucan biosynthesis protein [Steroidobacteraceae bacterium]
MHARQWLLSVLAVAALSAPWVGPSAGAQSPPAGPPAAAAPAPAAKAPAGKAPAAKAPAAKPPVAAAAAPAAPAAPNAAPSARPAGPATAGAPAPFGFDDVQRMAQQLATHPYADHQTPLPDSLTRLSYDQYRDIRFVPDRALWRNQALFEVQFFHRGFTYRRRVNINEVDPDGSVRPVQYDPADFDFGKTPRPRNLPPNLGFAGFRVHYPLQRPDYKDELIVFLGASYFRVLGRNESYGASARGLAINVATPSGEEFPYFTDFWLVKPPPQQRTLTIYALLDSPSLTGAYQFEVRPGDMTDVAVTGTLYPRKSVDKLGIAPLTSMYLYGGNSPLAVNDYRPEVHDSDGLLEQTGGGEWLWRPLVNPHMLRVSSFTDEHPRGFGLAQRDRAFSDYQDEEAHYQRRPSYWVTPLSDWGKGRIELVEIPTGEEIHDNIVAYWVPDTPLTPGKPFDFSYLLSAYLTSPLWPPGGRAVATRTATLSNRSGDNSRRILVDFWGGDLNSLEAAQPVQAQVSAHGGDISNITVQRLAEDGVWRVTFKLTPKGTQSADLRCYLTLYGEALTETWTYLYTP